ncbi:MAG: hypothetical protein JNL87_06895 [Burkholderiaceae bacterium]|nr:hypothetical protein [Burkholderiaceae bacterium]
MSALARPLADSYAAHPSFRFAHSAMTADLSVVHSFDTAYQAARDAAAKGAATELAWHQEQCERCLQQVFIGLSSQAQDDTERRFLMELLSECQRMLRTELGHFAKASAAKTGKFPGTRSRPLLQQLRSERHYFSALPAAAVEEMRQLAEAHLAGFRENARQGRLRREDLSVNDGPAVQAIARILNREFDASGTLDAVSAYMGYPMMVGGLALELSVPQATWWANGLQGLPRPALTLYAHLDESITAPKSIVYLSAVEPCNGPTSCYPHAYEDLGIQPLQEIIGRVVGNVGNSMDSPLRAHYQKRYHQSVTSEPFRRHFMRLPPELRFNSHLGWDVLPDSELESALVARERVMTGPPGTLIVFDGARLFHRGGLMQQGERIALQVVFDQKPKLRSRIIGKIKRAIA